VTSYWMVDDFHECPALSFTHRACSPCVTYARNHGDPHFIDRCGRPIYPRSGHWPPEQCAREALHDGSCRR
jgi:hypothetical protein